MNTIPLCFKPVEESAPKSPSPSREVSSSTIEAPSSQQEQDQKTQPPARQVKEPVQSPEDNRVSSMSDDTLTADQEHPALKDVVGLFRFDCHCFRNSFLFSFANVCLSCRHNSHYKMLS